MPLSYDNKANLINVDVAAKAILKISEITEEENRTYHITSPKVIGLEDVLSAASKCFGFDPPRVIPPEEFIFDKEYSFVQMKMMDPFIPYLDFHTTFDVKNTLYELEKINFVFPEFDEENLMRLFEYCSSVGFVKKKV